MKCVGCGQEIEGGATTCGNCGRAVGGGRDPARPAHPVAKEAGVIAGRLGKGLWNSAKEFGSSVRDGWNGSKSKPPVQPTSVRLSKSPRQKPKAPSSRKGARAVAAKPRTKPSHPRGKPARKRATHRKS
jgi:hypothetical protein